MENVACPVEWSGRVKLLVLKDKIHVIFQILWLYLSCKRSKGALFGMQLYQEGKTGKNHEYYSDLLTLKVGGLRGGLIKPTLYKSHKSGGGWKSIFVCWPNITIKHFDRHQTWWGSLPEFGGKSGMMLKTSRRLMEIIPGKLVIMQCELINPIRDRGVFNPPPPPTINQPYDPKYGLQMTLNFVTFPISIWPIWKFSQ